MPTTRPGSGSSAPPTTSTSCDRHDRANATGYLDAGRGGEHDLLLRVQAYNAPAHRPTPTSPARHARPAEHGHLASFAGSDGGHAGTWRGVYGADGYAMPDDAGSALPAYAHLSLPGRGLMAWAPADRRPAGPAGPAGAGRHAACW